MCRAGTAELINADGIRVHLPAKAAARALAAGATNIERVDRLVQAVAAQKGLRHPTVDETVALIDARLAENRRAVA